ncbi:MAG: SUMF1/EgtB/PvdO family nonheme iron enzyme [Candidatus Sumerlaeia bacterium]|nr:SUMF1/EgtB/PvdO family nonheme iron enzyme [Candidatus Sumerlaeia bacterium]
MSDPGVGDVLASKYEIKAVLGTGGMGTVYRARQMDLGRDVAIKVPKPEALEIPGFLARFTREARTVARLMHDNIVQVYEYSESEDLVYIAMEFVEGQDLKSLVGKPPDDLTVRDIAHILRGSCEGLSHAHESGIVHRDIKPHNIMVQRGSRNKWRVKIMDFGIAHLEANANFTVQQEQLTMTGQAIGTPSYMSPEQIRGSGVSGKSDIYSMGCVIFFCFTRSTPFQGSGFTVAAAHLSEPPPSIRARLPVLPPEVDRILAQCLEKDPDKRPRDASDLGQELFDALKPLFDKPMAELWNTAVEGLADTDLIPPTVGVDDDGQPGGATVTKTVDSGGQETVIEGQDGTMTEPVPSGSQTPTPGSQPTATQGTSNQTQAVTGSTHAYEGQAASASVVPTAPATNNQKTLLIIFAASLVSILLLGAVIGLLMSGGDNGGDDTTVIATGPEFGGDAPPPENGGGTLSVIEPGSEIPAPTPEANETEEPVRTPEPAISTPTPTQVPATATPEPTPTSDPFDTQLTLAEGRFGRLETLSSRVSFWQDYSREEDPRWREVTDEWARSIALNPEMRVVTSGNYSMGDENAGPDAPRHNVSLGSYHIGRYEVTALELMVYLNELPVEEARAKYPGGTNLNIVFNEDQERFLPRNGRALHPANGVSWELANDYTSWLSLQTGKPFRLPTEAEWEIAARSNLAYTFPWGNSVPTTGQANYAASGTVPVDHMTQGTTNLGLHHMAGNVAEWCLDYYDSQAYTRGDRRNPVVRTPPEGTSVPRRVVRGGSFLSRNPDGITSTARFRHEPTRNDADLGFRLVMEVD